MPKTASTQKKQNDVNLGCGRAHHADWHNFDIKPRDEMEVAMDHALLLEHLERQPAGSLSFLCLRPHNGILSIGVSSYGGHLQIHTSRPLSGRTVNVKERLRT